ncbi:ABC transporter ATP-binding protein [Variovorax sp. J22G73]|jgi:peptide/nickel transport system ATP-binding protein|uniref:ABC transporter ATP-binding protein n=1 Tax=unclassified Variovorax TaxID=663243 RepID=UPI002576B593|nr:MULTISPECIES: ABC transporter ATP-binding protein [unclassified Variovorax]MDM0009993.1 ABC transporter ATP-binding protein [Variovorax sp. J22R203]MDM0102501.1 ABC transporter ATP-binding protein [Variovorax sp. J22G73]
MTTPSAPLLSIQDLSIVLPSSGDRSYAVDRLSLDIAENEIVCLVGESGSGKSMTAHAILGLLPPRVKLDAKSRVLLEGADLTRLDAAGMRKLRGERIAMVFQEPMSALNPLQRIGAQVAEALQLHNTAGLAASAIEERCIALIEAVGLPAPRQIVRSYPFQLSGGQRQRVMIAMALLNNPRLLLADEPTTALDVTTQRQILDLIQKLQAERRMGVLFITHDFGVVADIADRVVVMRHGRVVEHGTRDEVLRNPQHEYTRKLIDAVPGRQARSTPLRTRTEPLLKISQLRKTFVSKSGMFAPPRTVVAADGIDLAIEEGETVSVVGESGSGKSTLGRMVMRLMTPDSGDIAFAGRSILSQDAAALREYRRQVQIIFQDPFASLNPRQKVGDAIARGPMIFGTPRAEALKMAAALLERVGLGASAVGRFPHEFSGGQRQRISIARALALKPRLLIADEAVSALDVSIQSQVLALLAELKAELGLTMMFITHDLRVAAEISNSVVVMRKGQIVERGAPGQLFSAPQHDYTRQLLGAMPGLDYFEHKLAA